MNNSALFIGTRLEALLCLKTFFNVEKIITVKNSHIHLSNDIDKKNIAIINKKNKNIYFELIKKSNVDLVFSAGFPFVLPEYALDNDKIYLNSHPGVLPQDKGYNVIRDNYKKNNSLYGVTLHYMIKNIDSGNIIFQKKKILENHSLNQIYDILFSKIEPLVIKQGMIKLGYKIKNE